MYLHANAKLGLAGRFALVKAIEEGMSLRAAAAVFNVSPATAHRWWHRWLEAGEEARRTLSCLFDRSSRPRRSPRQLAPELEETICVCRRADRLGTEAGRRRDWLRALDRLEGAQAGRDLAAAASGQGAGQPLRVALPRRSAAHGHEPLRALPAARPPGHRRPLAALAQLDASRDEGRLRLRARDRRRPLAARLRRAPRRRESSDRHRLPRTGARLLRRARDRREAADDRQRLQLRQEPLAARAARPRSGSGT